MRKLITLSTFVIGLSLLFFASAQAASSVTYYHHDALGSVIATSTQDGYMSLNEEYQPYGEKIYQTQDFSGGNEDWYTGKNYSKELDLTYFGARWYDAKQGRFLSMDPAGVNLADLHTFNRYHYANNNPYKYIDPDGNAVVTLTVIAIVALTSAWTTDNAINAYSEHTSVTSPGISTEGLAAAGESVLRDTAIAAVGGVGGLVAKSLLRVTKGAGKSRNKPPSPLKEAEGRPHSIIEKSGKDGQYTTHNGDGTWKQYRGSGQDHGGIPRPNVKEAGKNVTPDGRTFVDKGRVRPPKSNEIPGGD